MLLSIGRGREIRTPDPLLPNEAVRAALDWLEGEGWVRPERTPESTTGGSDGALSDQPGAAAHAGRRMNWLERAAREISGTAETPAAVTAKTPVSSVLAVTQGGIFQKSGDADADRAPPERDKLKFAGPPPGRSYALRAFPEDPRQDPRRAMRPVQGSNLGRVRARLCPWPCATGTGRPRSLTSIRAVPSTTAASLFGKDPDR